MVMYMYVDEHKMLSLYPHDLVIQKTESSEVTTKTSHQQNVIQIAFPKLNH